MSQALVLSSCFENRLQHHLTICNARVVTDLPHLRLNCNLRVCAGDEPPKVPPSSLPDEVLLAFINKLEGIHAGKLSCTMLSRGLMEFITYTSLCYFRYPCPH